MIHIDQHCLRGDGTHSVHPSFRIRFVESLVLCAFLLLPLATGSSCSCYTPYFYVLTANWLGLVFPALHPKLPAPMILGFSHLSSERLFCQPQADYTSIIWFIPKLYFHPCYCCNTPDLSPFPKLHPLKYPTRSCFGFTNSVSARWLASLHWVIHMNTILSTIFS